jgi:AcrR family transcriptional regulator
VLAGKVAGVEDTRLRILAATRELYATKGSRGTTTREVADRAGVNEATLFRHFGTKQQLLSEMLNYYSGVSDFPEMLTRIRSLPAIEEQLLEVASVLVVGMRGKEDLIKVSMAEELSNPDGSTCAWRAPTEARQRLGLFFEEKVSAGQLRGDPSYLARVFMSLFFAFVMARKMWSELDMPPEQAVRQLVEIFLNGARAN